jgi:hypothetical protein
MRTLTTFHRNRRVPTGLTLTRISALGLVAATALTLTGCGGSGSVKKTGGSATGGNSASSSASGSPTPSAPQSFDPAQGPTQDPATLPKTCSGLVTDADIQLALGQPLIGGDFFAVYQPVTGIKQTKKVKCQYGIVQGADGKIQSDQIEVQVATYADAASAQSRGASTVAGMAAQGAKFEQISISGHPATYITEANDVVLVMFDGNRTFLVTVNAILAKDDPAQKLTEKLADALYKHVTAATGPSTPTSSGASGTPSSGASPTDSGTPSAPASASNSTTPSAAPSS